jgi:hypothetical protein
MFLNNCNQQVAKWFVALIAVAAFMLATGSAASAQIHGVAASVTSQNFGGHINHAPGIPASVTSTGSIAPRIHRGNQFFPRAGCCINPLTPSNPNRIARRHREFRNRGGGAIFVPYDPYYSNLYYGDMEDEQQQQAQEPPEQYNGGPTIFDRRGPGGDQFPQPATEAAPPNKQQQVAAAAPEQAEPEAPEVPTVLVFKDGRQLEVSNYAIVGATLIDLTPGHRRKIALADLDIRATSQQNDDRGIDFKLPSAPQG